MLAVALLLPALAACSGSKDAKVGDAKVSREDATLSAEATRTPPAEREPDDLDEDAKASDVPKAVREQASKGTDAYLDEADDALRSPDPEKPQTRYDNVTGAALETLLNTVAEYDKNGWRVVGKPKVVSQEVIEESKKTLVVRACLDNSRVKVVDAEGAEVPNSRPANPRTLNILTLAKDKAGEWVVSDQRPAADPDC